jgi:hypothetical protein
MNIIDAIHDDKVFGQHFKAKTWDAWLAFLCALFALPMTEEQLALYCKHTGRSTPPTSPFREGWLCIGRRGGKSFVLAVIAVFQACFKDWRPFLGPGEYGTVMVVAQDRRQARVIMRYCIGLLNAVPMLKRQIESVTRESIVLKHRIVIEVHAASFRSTRGYSIVCALLDEIAYWPTDEQSAEPDVEVVNAIRPAMATIPGSMLLAASSPHARKGTLWEAHRRYHGKDDAPVLVWQATTREMNPSVSQSYIDSHMQEDAARASAEYYATFRSDLQSYIDRDVVLRCVSIGIRERAPERKHFYCAFADMSGGSRDSAVLCIGHNTFGKQLITIDCIREIKSPHSPEQACEEFAKVMRSYRVHKVITDKYASTWPVEQFSRFHVGAEQSADPKGTLYINLLPFLNSGRVELLDEPRGINQICALERSTGRGRGDTVDHPPNGFDDVANAIAGVVSICAKRGGYNLAAAVAGDDGDYARQLADARAARRPLHATIEDHIERDLVYLRTAPLHVLRNILLRWTTGQSQPASPEIETLIKTRLKNEGRAA